jgi:chitinase
MTMGWYPDWSVWTYPISSLDWSKLDVVDFAFAIPNANFDIEFTQYNSLDTLTELVSAGHAAGKKVRLSIGGWTGSVYFSPAVSSEWARQTFANNIAKVYNQYNLDGIDLDWEYPGVKGADANIVSSSDTANFLLFLQVLRKTLPPQALISSATQIWPFANEWGAPSADVSDFAQVLDWYVVLDFQFGSRRRTLVL